MDDFLKMARVSSTLALAGESTGRWSTKSLGSVSRARAGAGARAGWVTNDQAAPAGKRQRRGEGGEVVSLIHTHTHTLSDVIHRIVTTTTIATSHHRYHSQSLFPYIDNKKFHRRTLGLVSLSLKQITHTRLGKNSSRSNDNSNHLTITKKIPTTRPPTTLEHARTNPKTKIRLEITRVFSRYRRRKDPEHGTERGRVEGRDHGRR